MRGGSPRVFLEEPTPFLKLGRGFVEGFFCINLLVIGVVSDEIGKWGDRSIVGLVEHQGCVEIDMPRGG